MTNTTFHQNIKPKPLPLFAWANAHLALRPRERVRWSTDRFNLVSSYRREVVQ
jgi:hypothetical protein